MTISILGMDELISKLDRLGNDGRKIGNKALRAGAKIVLQQQKVKAPKKSHGGANSLKTSNIKTSAIKNKYIQVGLLKNAPWQSIRGIYFQHYGFRNDRTGRYHAPTLWIDKAFIEVKGKAIAAMKSELKKELKI